MAEAGAEPVIVSQGSLGSMRELKEQLEGRGVPAELVKPPAGRGSS